MYCLYPAEDTWDEFNSLKFYQYDGILWNEMDDALHLGDSSVNVPRSMVVMTDNEIYAFAVNAADLMVNVYSYRTSWRLHDYTGDIDKVEIDSVFVGDVMYFSVNEYDATGNYTVYHYMDDIFSVFERFDKIEVPIYSHCLSEFDGDLLTYYVDYGHHLWVYYDGVRYNMGFNIANQIQTNQFECIETEKGNIITWKVDTVVYYIHTVADDFKVIESYSMCLIGLFGGAILLCCLMICMVCLGWNYMKKMRRRNQNDIHSDLQNDIMQTQCENATNTTCTTNQGEMSNV